MSGIQEILLILVIIIAIIVLPRSSGKRPPKRPLIRAIHISGRIRLAIMLSLACPIVAAFIIRPWDSNVLAFIAYGLGPVVLGWAIGWVCAGFLKKHPSKKT
ncbi:MAG: hypothetical protein U9P80_06425 [Thermodesulfobacteriota bacterium]|nr:hypothetical protein [Thermodesulfobacteriota bacterium]